MSAPPLYKVRLAAQREARAIRGIADPNRPFVQVGGDETRLPEPGADCEGLGPLGGGGRPTPDLKPFEKLLGPRGDARNVLVSRDKS